MVVVIIAVDVCVVVAATAAVNHRFSDGGCRTCGGSRDDNDSRCVRCGVGGGSRSGGVGGDGA